MNVTVNVTVKYAGQSAPGQTPAAWLAEHDPDGLRSYQAALRTTARLVQDYVSREGAGQAQPYQNSTTIQA